MGRALLLAGLAVAERGTVVDKHVEGLKLQARYNTLAESHDALVEALEKLHDATDDINCEFAKPGRYCTLCRADRYNAQAGVDHRAGCPMRQAREVLDAARLSGTSESEGP